MRVFCALLVLALSLICVLPARAGQDNQEVIDLTQKFFSLLEKKDFIAIRDMMAEETRQSIRLDLHVTRLKEIYNNIVIIPGIPTVDPFDKERELIPTSTNIVIFSPADTVISCQRIYWRREHGEWRIASFVDTPGNKCS